MNNIKEEMSEIETLAKALEARIECDCKGEWIAENAHYASCKGLLKAIK